MKIKNKGFWYQNTSQKLSNLSLLKNGRVTGVGEGESHNYGCFACTAFNEKSNNILSSLRVWRNQTLTSGHIAKTAFIKLYYTKFTKPASQLLRKLPFLKPISRQMIFLFIVINGIKVERA